MIADADEARIRAALAKEAPGVEFAIEHIAATHEYGLMMTANLRARATLTDETAHNVAPLLDTMLDGLRRNAMRDLGLQHLIDAEVEKVRAQARVATRAALEAMARRIGNEAGLGAQSVLLVDGIAAQAMRAVE